MPYDEVFAESDDAAAEWDMYHAAELDDPLDSPEFHQSVYDDEWGSPLDYEGYGA